MDSINISSRTRKNMPKSNSKKIVLITVVGFLLVVVIYFSNLRPATIIADELQKQNIVFLNQLLHDKTFLSDVSKLHHEQGDPSSNHVIENEDFAQITTTTTQSYISWTSTSKPSYNSNNLWGDSSYQDTDQASQYTSDLFKLIGKMNLSINNKHTTTTTLTQQSSAFIPTDSFSISTQPQTSNTQTGRSDERVSELFNILNNVVESQNIEETVADKTNGETDHQISLAKPSPIKKYLDEGVNDNDNGQKHDTINDVINQAVGTKATGQIKTTGDLSSQYNELKQNLQANDDKHMNRIIEILKNEGVDRDEILRTIKTLRKEPNPSEPPTYESADGQSFPKIDNSGNDLVPSSISNDDKKQMNIKDSVVISVPPFDTNNKDIPVHSKTKPNDTVEIETSLKMANEENTIHEKDVNSLENLRDVEVSKANIADGLSHVHIIHGVNPINDHIEKPVEIPTKPSSNIETVQRGFINVVQWSKDPIQSTRYKCVTFKTVAAYPKICVHPIDKDPEISGQLAARGTWEMAIMRDIQLALFENEDAGLIDIGAGIGEFSIAAAAIDRHVVAIEPSSVHYDPFQMSVRANGFSDKITLLSNVVSNQHGKVTVYPSDKSINEIVIDTQTDGTNGKIVGQITLDDIASVCPFKTAVMKIDIPSSYVQKALSQSSNLFKAIKVTHVFMHWTTTDKQLCKFLTMFFTDMGYTPYSGISSRGALEIKDALVWDTPNVVWKRT